MTEQEILVDIRERLVRLETLVGSLVGTEAKLVEVDERGKSNTHRIDKLEANNTWLWRTIAGAIIVAAVSAVLVLN